jgi:hypothetical protein
MSIKEWVQLGMLLLMLVGLVGILHNRLKLDKGIGVRAIQFLAVVEVLPAIVILSLEGILEGQTTGTLLGAVIGYVLSGIGKDERGKRPKAEPSKGLG